MGASRDRPLPNVDETRWSIGWNPLVVILPTAIAGIVVGYAIDDTIETIAIVGIVGVLAGIGIWYWGVQEVNRTYIPFFENFRDSTRQRVADETGGLTINSMYTFVSAGGGSPPLIEPEKNYYVSHMVIGDTSVVINEEFSYDMKQRSIYRGGEQAELFYDQITNVQSEHYSNVAHLQVSLSGGQTKEIPSRDPESVETVKAELQQYIRAARRE